MNTISKAKALSRWQQRNPAVANSETHQQAFLSGFDAGREPEEAPTKAEMIASLAAHMAAQREAEAQAKRERLAKLPTGTCVECEGEGEFVGALHATPCDACNGTGKVA